MMGFLYDVLSFAERRRQFTIIWLFMSIQIKYLNNAQSFSIRLMQVFVLHFVYKIFP